MRLKFEAGISLCFLQFLCTHLHARLDRSQCRQLSIFSSGIGSCTPAPLVFCNLKGYVDSVQGGDQQVYLCYIAFVDLQVFWVGHI